MMQARDIKPGLDVELDRPDLEERHEGAWTVLDKAPGSGFYWLHRNHEERGWESHKAHARELELVGDPYREARK